MSSATKAEKFIPSQTLVIRGTVPTPLAVLVTTQRGSEPERFSLNGQHSRPCGKSLEAE